MRLPVLSVARYACLALILAAVSLCFIAAEEKPRPGGTEEPKKAIVPPGPTNVEITGHVYHPVVVPATDERIASLKAPPGFKIEKWADELGNPRIIAVGEEGTVYVTRRKQKDLLMLRDTDGDGKADQRKVIAKKEPMLHGIAIHDGKMYLTTIKEIYVAKIRPDGTIGAMKQIIDQLPDGGQHPNRTIAFGPDGMFYISSGSASNAATEPNPEHATILRADPKNGWKREIFARGLRNTIGFDWHPQTKELFGADHGIDWLGDNEQKEEFNHIQKGKHYGWPVIYADGQYNPADEPPDGQSYAEFAAKTKTPALLYTAHSAPMMMTFYPGGQFPQEYKNDVFLAMRGSWNRRPPSGHEIVHIDFDRRGRPTAIEPFVTGFLKRRDDGEWERFGRPVGVAVMKDGSLLIGDDTNGVLYRIHYTGKQKTSARAPHRGQSEVPSRGLASRSILSLLTTAFLAADAAAEPIEVDHFDPEPIRITLDELPPPYHTMSARNSPRVVPPPEDPVLNVPGGFRVNKFAEVEKARWLALTPQGDVLCAASRQNKIFLLQDTDGDGAADRRRVFVDESNGANLPFGMAFAKGSFFLGNTDAVLRYPYDPSAEPGASQLGRPEKITSLPGEGYRQHWTRNVVISPDEQKLFASVGSKSNVKPEELPRASILRMNLDGSQREVFAYGLRNPVGLDFQPQTGELYTTVNERDGLGDNLVPDYLAHVIQGEFYGWPYAYLAPRFLDPRRMENDRSERPELVAKTHTPDVLFQSHSAALGLSFYGKEKFPDRYHNGAFAAFRGSWNRDRGTGYKIVFVPFDEQGQPKGYYEDFVTGFLLEPKVPKTWGRPVGVLTVPDGSLLFTEEANGRIYRVHYAGQSKSGG